MAHGESSLTWSLRHEALRGPEAERVLEDVATTCRALCRAHLPRASGYELTCARLSGPLDGVTITVARANFRAVVSVQRFEASTDAERATRLRLVASAHHVGAEADAEGIGLARLTWGLSGCIAATMAAGALALHVAGFLATWASTILLLPALVGTRVCMAMWIGDNLRQRELPASRAEQAQHFARAAAELRDLSRWRKILRELEAQRDVVTEQFQLRPFRGLSPAGVGEASQPALTVAASIG